MLNKEDYLLSLFDIVEGFNKCCILYKKKYCSSFIFSSNVLTKNERNKDTQDFKKTFNDFVSKIEFLHMHIIEKSSSQENIENICVNLSNCQKDKEEYKTIHSKRNDLYGDHAEVESIQENDRNSNNEKNQKERSKRKINENVVGTNNEVENINEEDKEKTLSHPNSYNVQTKVKKMNYQDTFEVLHSDFSISEDSLVNTDFDDEKENLIISKINEVLIRYVTCLDYTLNVRRISRVNLIEEIKEFYKIHNSSIKLNEYSSYLNDETIDTLKRCVENNNLNVLKKYENIFKNITFFFSIPKNYFFIKNYDDQNRHIFPTSYYMSYEKGLNGINNAHTLSNNSSSINGNNYNLYTDNILSENNSYIKFNSPTFGMHEERQMSPNFGAVQEGSKDENDEYNEFDNPSYSQNGETGNACFSYSSKNGHNEKNDQELNKVTSFISKRGNYMCDSPSTFSIGNYNNDDENGKPVKYKSELENYYMYDINNIDNKKNNLHSNTSDFYQSISDFYRSKENHSNFYEEDSNTCMKNSSHYFNSNETSVQANNKSYQENEKNIIHFCFDDELSSAITINNESSLSKEVDVCKHYHLHDKDVKNTMSKKSEQRNQNIPNEEHNDKDEEAIEYEKDERKWLDEYCEGDYNLFRSKQIKMKKELMLSSSNDLSINEVKEKEYARKKEKLIGEAEMNSKTNGINIFPKSSYTGCYKDIITDDQNNFDNTYNSINLKIVYETNKNEFSSKGEMNFFRGQTILNKYKVVKILSKTKFSTTLKCLNMLYRNDKTQDDTKQLNVCTQSEYDEPKMSATTDVLELNTYTGLKNSIRKMIPYDNHQLDEEDGLSKEESLLSNKMIRKKNYKYVCLKVMKNGKSFLDQGLFELIVLNMLSNESIDTKNRKNNTLTNKNIIQLYDYFYFKEHLIIVTEYMQSDLYNYFIKKGKLGTLGQLQILAKNLLEGLAYIHSKNLIHCDLKPENIMINMKRGKKKLKKFHKMKNGGNDTDSSLLPQDTIKKKIVSTHNDTPMAEKDRICLIDNLSDKDCSTVNITITKEETEKYKGEKNEGTQKAGIHVLEKSDRNVSSFCESSSNVVENAYFLDNQKKNSKKCEKISIFSSKKFEKIKIIDFNSSIYESDKLEMYVQTRSYRSPEVLLQQNYDKKIDIWSLGCILFEFLTKKILFDHQNIYRFLYSIASYIGPFPFYMINICRIPYLFTKHGLIILNKIIIDKSSDNCVKEEVLDELDDEQVIFNSKDFFRLNKQENSTNDLLKNKNENHSSYFLPKRNQEVYYDVCYPSDNLLKHNFHIDDLLFIDFLLSLLQIDPCKRPNSDEALKHPWLKPNIYQDGL
ncbi:serine/threonine protein kinase [Plasmodium gonderi]|uniref:Serine/threonine protein kinase n=1 Tax=Plasmodium gonderi TaxID=77519 RepID=A0A1Y1JJH5_PLAGO|nr:serine/threonine protein kinase [Plasmodium gonderi]GAW82656.1 serine/threonine protein kinase [Plasmodium gonderi]